MHLTADGSDIDLPLRAALYCGGLNKTTVLVFPMSKRGVNVKLLFYNLKQIRVK